MSDERRLYAWYAITYIFLVAASYVTFHGLHGTLDRAELIRSAFEALAPAFIVIATIRRYLWHFAPIRHALGVEVPYVHGRWVGHIVSSRTKHSVEHAVVLEIWQTLDSVGISYFDEMAVTNSLIAGFVSDVAGGPHRLYCVYRNQPIKTHERALQTHNGVMELIVSGDGRRITGTYYNNPHQRSTYGYIEVALAGRKLFRSFVSPTAT